MRSSEPGRKVEVTPEDGRRSLLQHAVDNANAARARYGPHIGLSEIEAMLGDPTIVRYPTRLAYDSTGIDAGMFARALPCGPEPRDGFLLHVHPHFAGRSNDLPLLIAYHLVSINYGEIANHEVAEQFGAALLGLSVEDYYRQLCGLADELEPPKSC